jgi:hypothetical protein
MEFLNITYINFDLKGLIISLYLLHADLISLNQIIIG